MLYEIAGIEGGEFPLARAEMLDMLYRHFESLLTQVDHPEHKRKRRCSCSAASSAGP